jgi:hypothetical protein
MFITILKTLSYLWPFLREVVIGKYSKDTRYKWIKLTLLIMLFISMTINILFGKIVYILSNEKIDYVNQLNNALIELNKEKKKVCHVITVKQCKGEKVITLDEVTKSPISE